ncbi:MAG: hypothetical protein JJLCMIEE_00095 [Acidimicrobiales bacterium]|nr:MAG: hypothetical protein EDR02_00745 [Actinomycetota bacterium]MBV6507058.1 hypothetical protein [Acidimicrobiales bacterium]RIK05633.1 MAG: hypothetical protein DCC48_10180 [Acidobacteriota bacterium]
MFKRLFWLMIGIMVGLTGSFWLQRRIRRRVERLLPDRLPTTAADAASNLAETVKEAVSEGRAAMREREAELRRLSRPLAEAPAANSAVDPGLAGAEVVSLSGRGRFGRARPRPSELG